MAALHPVFICRDLVEREWAVRQLHALGHPWDDSWSVDNTVNWLPKGRLPTQLAIYCYTSIMGHGSFDIVSEEVIRRVLSQPGSIRMNSARHAIDYLRLVRNGGAPAGQPILTPLTLSPI